MSDIVDAAAEIIDEHVASGVARARAPIAAGAPGECDGCGEFMPRLVDGQCGFCRDGRLPPPGWEPPVARPLTQEEPRMSNGKTVMLPPAAKTAISALEAFARENSMPLGQAAVQLIERGLANAKPPATASADPASDLASADLDAIFGEIRARLSNSDELAAVQRDRDEALGRAEAAEARLAQAKAIFG